MKRILLAGVVLAFCAAGAVGQERKAQVSVITSPDWLRQPTPEAIRGAYPSNATAKKGEGRIRCVVTVQGLLRDCKIASENPEGQGFGAAALAMAPQFLFRPATRDGRPFEAEATIPVMFNCEVACRQVAKGGQKIVNGLNWAAAPTQLEMVAAYPPKAKAKHILGVASIQCEISAKTTLKNCQAMSEEPLGQGFGGAAIGLAKYFQQPTNVGPGVKLDGSLVRLAFTFGEQMYDGAPYVAKPRYAAVPTSRELMDAYRASSPDKDIVAGSAVVRCKIVEAGTLSECSLVSETPAARGVGAAVLAVAPKFRLATWTEDGLPVIGTFVRLPMKFDIKDPPKVAEPAKQTDAP